MIINQFFLLAKKSINAWIDDYAPSMGAAISYYTVFSIAPLLLIVIAVAGLVWGQEAVQGEIVGQLSGLLGEEGATGIQALIESANKPAKGIVATVISVFVLIIGATTVFAELQSALDRVWGIPPEKQNSGIWATLRARLLSLGFILGLGFLLSVSLVLSAGVAAFGGWAGGLLPGWEILLQIINMVVSLSVAMVLFALIFKLMPQASVSWSDVWVGAAVTAVLFESGKWLIGLYIGKSSVSSSFAAAGSLVVLLIWVYYSAQIFLLGAEFTWVYAHEHGSLKGQPNPKEIQKAGNVVAKPPSASHPLIAANSANQAQQATFDTADAVHREKRPQQWPHSPANTKASVAFKGTPMNKSSDIPSLKQRAVVYGVTALLSFMVKRYFKKQSPPVASHKRYEAASKPGLWFLEKSKKSAKPQFRFWR